MLDHQAGLWMPRKFRRTRALPASPELSFVIPTVGYEEVCGIQATWTALEARLRHFSRPRLIDLIGRLSWLLDRRRYPEQLQFQVQLVRTLFGRNGKDVIARCHRQRNELGSEVALFHERQLQYLAKSAFLVDLPQEAEERAHPRAFLEALLLATDLANQEHQELEQVARGDSRRWQLFVFANQAFNEKENLVHAIARSFELYFRDRRHLASADRASFVNLPRALEQATRCDAAAVRMAIFAINARWLATPAHKLLTEPMKIVIPDYFTSGFDISEQVVALLLRLVAASEEAILEEVRSSHAPPRLESLSPLPFGRHPIVTFGKIGLPVSAPYLRRKMTSGVHHFFLDSDRFNQKERAKFLRYMGLVFEDYVCELLRRAFGRDECRFVSGSTLRALVSGKCCDGLVRYPAGVVIVEAKSSIFPLAARTGQGWREYARWVRDVMVDGAAQLSATARSIRNDELTSLGLRDGQTQRILPLVITLDKCPTNSLAVNWAMDAIREECPDLDPCVQMLQVMEIGELELVEEALRRGRTLESILTSKLQSEVGRVESFTNWWFRTCDPILEQAHNEYLGEVYRRIGQDAQAWLRRRAKAE